jgi:hypothetical protein
VDHAMQPAHICPTTNRDKGKPWTLNPKP